MSPNETNEPTTTSERDEFPALWYQCTATDGDWAPVLRRVEPGLRCALRAFGESYGVRLNRDLIDEIIQNTYVRLWEHDRRVLRQCNGQSEAAIMSYLCSVARSALIDWMRRNRASKRGTADAKFNLREERIDYLRRNDRPGPTDPFNAIHLRELRCRFRRECRFVAGRNSRRDTWITERILLDGWSPSEAADAVDLAPATVTSLISKMRRELRHRGLEMPLRRSGHA